MLRLQTQPGAARVHLAAFAVDRSVQEIAGVKLQARLRGHYFKNAAADRLLDARGQAQSASVQHPVVIVAMAELQLLVIGFDSRTYASGFSKVERRAGDGAKL